MASLDRDDGLQVAGSPSMAQPQPSWSPPEVPGRAEAEAAQRDPAFQASAASGDWQTRVSCSESTGRYIAALLAVPSLDRSMTSFHQLNWVEAYVYWNIKWTQSIIVCALVEFVFRELVALVTLNLFRLLVELLLFAFFGVLRLLAFYAVGYLGWFRVSLHGWQLFGNFDYFAIGIGHFVIAWYMVWPLNIVYVVPAALTPFLLLACWRLGHGARVREFRSEVVLRTQAPLSASSGAQPLHHQDHEASSTGFEMTSVH